MDNVVILTSSDSDSDFSDDSGGHSDREEIIYESEYFMNHVNKKEYEKNRNKLFTKDIEEVNIIVENIDNTDRNNYTYNFQSNFCAEITSNNVRHEHVAGRPLCGMNRHKHVAGRPLR